MDSKTITRTVLFALALVNQVLVALKVAPLPVDSEQVYTLVSTAFTIGTGVWSWYKNNNVTKAAQEAQHYLDSMKQSAKASKKAFEAQNKIDQLQTIANAPQALAKGVETAKDYIAETQAEVNAQVDQLEAAANQNASQTAEQTTSLTKEEAFRRLNNISNLQGEELAKYLESEG